MSVGVDVVRLTLTLNGKEQTLEVPAYQLLLDALRQRLGATDVRYGCGEGVCGTCTVLIDGDPVSSCLVLAVQANGRKITTVRGLSVEDGRLHELQRMFLEKGAAQCGFCTPGMLLTLLSAIERGAAEREEFQEAISGNLCRCTGYKAILDSAEAFVLERTSKDALGTDR